jgi:predicted glycosyltransferase
VWIDLDNSPHVPFFLPIIEELEKRGLDVIVTARDAYQVCELVDYYHVRCKVVGRHYGKNRIMKVLGSCLRAVELAAHVIWKRPDIGVSHGSRSQLLACFALRIPNLTIFDYEFVATTGFIHPTWAMAPEVVPADSTGFAKCPVLKYPGIKEDVYLSRFHPDPSLRERLGVGAEDLLVMLRPPATEAHYHNPESDVLLDETLAYLAEHMEAKTVILPRNDRQASTIRRSYADAISSGRLIIPSHVEDGLNLIWNSDLVISGGGTMNREAAAMRVPVYSIFRGKIGAVDHYLVREGRLVLLETVADVRKKLALVRRQKDARHFDGGASKALTEIVENIKSMVEDHRPFATHEYSVQ